MRRLLNYVLTSALVLVSFQLFSQQAIQQKVQQNAQQISNSTLYEIFEKVEDANLNNQIPPTTLSKKQFFQLKEPAIQTIATDKKTHMRISMPVGGQQLEFELFKANIFTPDFQTVIASGNPVQTKLGLHYWGVVKNEPNSLVALSFFDDEIAGLIRLNDATYNINKYKNTGYHLMYKTNDLNFTPNFSCSALPTKLGNSDISISGEKSIPNDCVRIHVEADYGLYQSKGSSIANTTNYINGLFSQVGIMYANESISIAISYINIWTSTSPYTSGNELSELGNVAYGRTHGDLVHLLHRNGGGGVAYLDVLCNSSFNMGVSGVDGFYNNVPTYSWDVFVVSHELGHNMGSPHTHDCTWNGNGTAIDGCGFQASNGADGCTGPIPSLGTIMSYCHLINGIDFTQGFGQQPGDLIRNRVANAACLSPCGPPTCDDGYQCGGSLCIACPTCDDGIQNQDETGVDCGGANCLPCSCAGGVGISLIIFGDFYTNETTWTITNSTGATVAAGGPFGQGLPSIVEAICLPPGCYDFTIFDSYGDGLFDGNRTGTYTLIDEYGNPLASGAGNFGASESTNFCVSSACAAVDLDILFDGFPGQTSWDITDNSNGSIVTMGGTYNSQPGNSNLSTSPACLPDGCYTLNFYDALGNGMCPFQSSAVGVSTFITPGTLITPGSIVGTLSLVATPGLCGNYVLTDANGTQLASGGGGFGSSQSNSFCITNGAAAPRYSNDIVKALDILPNPVVNKMLIQTNFNLDETVELQIVDMLGKVVLQQTLLNQTTIETPVDNLKTGVYLVQLVSNNQMISKKFIKK